VKKRLDFKESSSRPLANENLQLLYESRYPLYVQAADIVIDANDKSVDEIAQEISEML
jgi:shikimate kinase